MNLRRKFAACLRGLREKRLLKSLQFMDVPPRGDIGSRKRILMFAPEAGIQPHFHMMCIVGRTLQERGHDVWMARCNRQFMRCPVMGAHRATFDIDEAGRHAVCEQCVHISLDALDRYHLKHLDLQAFDDAKLAGEFEAAVAGFETQLENFAFDGIDFGALTAFEVAVALKKTVLDSADPDVRCAWGQLIRGAVKSYLLTRRILSEYRFTHVAYFNDYSIQLAVGLAAGRHGARARLITQPGHRNVDRRRCVIYDRWTAQDHYWIQDRWRDWRQIPLPKAMVVEVAEDLLFRFRGQGSHIYSPPKTHGGVAPSLTRRRRIVAYTSSPDEVTGARVSNDTLGVSNPPWQLTFPAPPHEFHEMWLRALCKYVADRDDVELLIRIHPREGANKREPNSSAHLLRLQKGLQNLPENCTVIWPEDKISSYDLGESADLVLVSWSTVGLEMSRLGMPVLCSTWGISGVVADDFQEFSTDQNEYFAKLERLMKAPPNFATLRRAYRWWHLFCIANSLDLTDLVPASDYCGLPPFRLPAQSANLERAVLSDESVFDINRSCLLASQNPKSPREEDAALQAQCRRIMRLLVTGEDSAKDFALAYIHAGAVEPSTFESLHPWLRSPRRTWIVIDCDREVLVVADGRVTRKFSPMIARLGFLGAGFSFAPDFWFSGAAPEAKRLETMESVGNLD